MRKGSLIIIIFTALTAINGSPVKTKKQNENRGNFIDVERTKHARLMASYMDKTADPCDDFYQYACGNFNKIHKVKQAASSTGVFDVVADEMNEALHEILSEPVKSDKKSVTDKAKLFYQSCMKVNIFNYPKSDTYLKLIESIGGWPVLDSTWNPDKFDWFNLASELASLGGDAFLKVKFGYNGEYYLMIVDDDFGVWYELSANTYSKEYIANKELIMKIANIYDIPMKDIKEMYDEIIELGKEWKTFTEAIDVKGLDVDYNQTIKSLKEEVPEIDWDKLTFKVFGKEINSSFQIYVELNFLKKLPTFFTKENAATVANYMILKLLAHLHNEFYFPKYQKDFCMSKVKGVMSDVITFMYLNSKHHQDTVEDEVMSMASYMRGAFKDIIKESDWMDIETKRKALIKLRDMRMVIGDVELSLDLKTMEEEYKDLQIDVNNNYYENNLIVLRHQTQKRFNQLLSDDFSEQERYESDVNAYYNPSANKMILPAGILRIPFFISALPNSYNYAAMGANILGHEMTHGFDSQGRYFDENGNEEDWWSDEASAAFDERAKCFVEQYNSYRIPEMNINVRGNLTLGENIADSGGVRQGFFAYQKWLKAHEGQLDPSREILPHLNMTNYQLFFLSYAQSYCGKYKREMYKIIDKDVHAADKFRVIGSVSNFDEFGKQFNCKLGTTMNPEKKCVLW